MKLSIGECALSAPGLRGWKIILSAVSSDQYRALLDVALDAKKKPEGDEAIRSLCGRLLPVLPHVPDVLAAVARACLRNEKGDRISDAQAWDMTEADIEAFLSALVQADFVREVAARLKNLADLAQEAPAAG